MTDSADTAKQAVLEVHPTAFAASYGKGYRIVRPRTEADRASLLANVIFTSVYDTEAEAWMAAEATLEDDS
jgi:hypothetical protein